MHIMATHFAAQILDAERCTNVYHLWKGICDTNVVNVEISYVIFAVNLLFIILIWKIIMYSCIK